MSDKKITATEQIRQLNEAKEPLFEELGRYSSEKYLNNLTLSGDDIRILKMVICDYQTKKIQIELNQINREIENLSPRAEREKTVQNMTKEDMEKIFPGGKSKTLEGLQAMGKPATFPSEGKEKKKKKTPAQQKDEECRGK